MTWVFLSAWGADSATRLDGKAGNVVNAIAIGAGAKANRDNSIAIGGGANTDAAGVAQTSYTMSNGDTVNWAGGENVLPGDVVSFGAPGYERQLKKCSSWYCQCNFYRCGEWLSVICNS